jgi:formate dehydrogenase accessory protein FdhE
MINVTSETAPEARADFSSPARSASKRSFIKAKAGVTKRVAYHEIEGAGGFTKCETCEECTTYSKIFYQTNDMAVEALCDDLATLSLDLLVQDAGWKRHAPNPFVLAM